MIKAFLLIVFFIAGRASYTQNANDLSILNEVKVSIDKYRDYELANDMLNKISVAGKNDPLYFYYKYKVYSQGSNSGKGLGAQLDSTHFYLQKYLDFFPGDLSLQQEIIDLRIRLKQCVSKYIKSVFTRRNYDKSNIVSVDSMELIVSEDKIIGLKFSITPKCEVNGEKYVKPNNSKKDRETYTTYYKSCVQEFVPQLKVYFTLKVVSPIFYYRPELIDFLGDLSIDSITEGTILYTQERRMVKETGKKARFGYKTDTPVSMDSFYMSLKESAKSDLIAQVRNNGRICVSLENYRGEWRCVLKTYCNKQAYVVNDHMRVLHVLPSVNDQKIFDNNSSLNFEFSFPSWGAVIYSK